MKTAFVEATNGPRNWGKFMVAQFDADEWSKRSAVSTSSPLIGGRGWTIQHALVLDLQTGEGAIFYPHRHALPKADLEKHQIWVCPLFEPFLEWLYAQDLWDGDAVPADIGKLPRHIDLPHAEFSFAGHRRSGPSDTVRDGVKDNHPAPRLDTQSDGGPWVVYHESTVIHDIEEVAPPQHIAAWATSEDLGDGMRRCRVLPWPVYEDRETR